MVRAYEVDVVENSLEEVTVSDAPRKDGYEWVGPNVTKQFSRYIG